MKVKRVKLILILILVLTVTFFFIVGFFSSWIGYKGYNKDKLRFFSKSRTESLARGVFIKDLAYQCDSLVKIDAIYIERAFKWGEFSSEKTRVLEKADTFRDNEPELQYQLLVKFEQQQFDKLIYMPNSYLKWKNRTLKDTLIFDIYIRNLSNELLEIKKMKVWE